MEIYCTEGYSSNHWDLYILIHRFSKRSVNEHFNLGISLNAHLGKQNRSQFTSSTHNRYKLTIEYLQSDNFFVKG